MHNLKCYNSEYFILIFLYKLIIDDVAGTAFTFIYFCVANFFTLYIICGSYCLCNYACTSLKKLGNFNKFKNKYTYVGDKNVCILMIYVSSGVFLFRRIKSKLNYT